MLGSSQHDFRATELDPDLLSTPFEVQTNWHVITGAVCSGKTTLIDQLADKGFQTVPETGRQYVEREVARGRTLFMLHRLPVQRNGLRTEDDAVAVLLDEWLARDYIALGYSVVRVPVLWPQERLAFVLERLSEQGLI